MDNRADICLSHFLFCKRKGYFLAESVIVSSLNKLLLLGNTFGQVLGIRKRIFLQTFVICFVTAQFFVDVGILPDKCLLASSYGCLFDPRVFIRFFSTEMAIVGSAGVLLRLLLHLLGAVD